MGSDEKDTMVLHSSTFTVLNDWQPPEETFWKAKYRCCLERPISKAGGLGWMLQNHLGCVHIAGSKFIPRYSEVKKLEVMTICLGMESISQILYLNLLVESIV